MKVSDILSAKGHFVLTTDRHTFLSETLMAMVELNFGAAVVVDDAGEPVGIISERGIARALHEVGAEALHKTVEFIMEPVEFIATEASSVPDLMTQMTNRRTRHIPVVDESGQLDGIVSIGDLVKARMDELEFDRQNLIDYVTH